MTTQETIDVSFWIMVLGLALFAFSGIGFLIEEHRYQRLRERRDE